MNFDERIVDLKAAVLELEDAANRRVQGKSTWRMVGVYLANVMDALRPIRESVKRNRRKEFAEAERKAAEKPSGGKHDV